MKASIQLTVKEYESLNNLDLFIHDIDYGWELTCYGTVLHMTEDNLAKFLYYLPLDHYLRSRFQRAGEAVFTSWRK